MTNRREFLQTGVAVSALPLAINGILTPDAAAASADVSNVRLYKAIFDDRYAESLTFAREVGRFRVPGYALENGDVTDLWYELDLHWRNEPAAIAGSTQFGPLFVLERLAHEHGMRVAIRVEHQVRADGTLAHVMSASRETLALAERLRSEQMDWPAMMAALVSHCRVQRTAPISHTLVMPGAQPVLTDTFDSRMPESIIHYYTTIAIQQGHSVPWDGPLFSWLIAPEARS
jgi:hypothetical protein